MKIIEYVQSELTINKPQRQLKFENLAHFSFTQDADFIVHSETEVVCTIVEVMLAIISTYVDVRHIHVLN